MCGCHSIPERCVMFSGVKLSMGSFVLLLIQQIPHNHKDAGDFPKIFFGLYLERFTGLPAPKFSK